MSGSLYAEYPLDLKDRYEETVMRDYHACQQLNNAEKSLSLYPNEIYNPKQAPTKWIVSTSFEGINIEIDGCIKINYFELLNCLKNPDIISISGLIKDMYSNRNIKLLYDEFSNGELDFYTKMIVKSAGIPIPIFDSSQYCRPLLGENEEHSIEFSKRYHKALELDRENRKPQAIALLKKCLLLKENDGDVWGAIANIYTDLENYEDAFFAFKRALHLLPNDPFIMRNYALALFDAGEEHKGLSLLLDFLQKFPLLEDVRILFQNRIVNNIKNKILKENDILILLERWDKVR